MATPNAPKEVLDGSSVVLRKHWKDQERLYGRRLRFEEKWHLIYHEPEGPYVGGRTHRWTYVFWDSFKFLSYYIRTDGTMIRPTWEVESRLLNPERRLNSLDRHLDLLICSLCENVFNKHTVNHILHYFIDAQWMA